MTAQVKRDHYRIVNRPHQYRILSVILFYNLSLAVFLAFVFFLPDILTINDQTLNIEIRAMASERILTLHSQAWPAVIAMICLICLHSVRVFSRTVGPLYRFTVAFNQARDGNLGYHVILRTKDHLHREASAYNEMLAAVSEKIAGIQAAGHESLQLLEKVESGIKKTCVQDEPDTKNVADLRKRLEYLVSSAGYFKTKRPNIETMPPDPSEEIEYTFVNKNSLSNRSCSAAATGLTGG